MKNFKLLVTAFILLLIQTSLGRYIDIWGIVPNLILVFVICMTILEDSFARLAVGAIAAGAAAGALGVNSFYYTLLFFVWSAMALYMMPRRELRRNLPFAVLCTAILSALFEGLYFALHYGVLSAAGISANVMNIAAAALYNTVIMIIMYPFMKFFVYRTEKGGVKLKLN